MLQVNHIYRIIRAATNVKVYVDESLKLNAECASASSGNGFEYSARDTLVGSLSCAGSWVITPPTQPSTTAYLDYIRFRAGN